LKEPSNRIDFSNTTGTVVECAATGNPRPEILWIKADGSPVTDVPGLRQVTKTKKMNIRETFKRGTTATNNDAANEHFFLF
jgi:hypothetical protein